MDSGRTEPPHSNGKISRVEEPLDGFSNNKIKPGNRSRLSQAKTIGEFTWNICWFGLRAVYCAFQIVFFLLAYFGFMIPILWAKELWPRLYWFLEGQLYRWLQAFVAYWGYTAGYTVYEYGDDIKKYSHNDRVLVISNHQSTADVPTLFAVFHDKGVVLRKTLWIMSSQFRFTPFGIVGRMHGDHFIKSERKNREQPLIDLKNHLQKVFWNRDRRWVILFPEGGFFYRQKDSNLRYARANGFPELTYVTLPRLGAIQTILNEIGPRVETGIKQEHIGQKSMLAQIRETIGAILEKKHVRDTRPPIQYVLDATIAYPHNQPLSLATLCFGTREKCSIAIYYKLYDVSEIPFRDELLLRDWMYNLYIQKDKLLEYYYKHGNFQPNEKGRCVVFPLKLIFGQYTFWIAGIILQVVIYKFFLYNLISFFAH